MSAELNPYSVMCIVKHDGKEVGRVAATAHNAEVYLTEMAQQYGSINVDYVEDSTAARIDRMIRSPVKQ